MILKNFCSFKEPIDFNSISYLLDRHNLKSTLSSNWIGEFILESVFKIEDVQKDFMFKEIFNLLNNTYNKENKKSNLYIFFSFVTGNKSTTHIDDYDVYILGLYGKTFYKIEQDEFYVEPGDLLYIPKNKLHKAVGLGPRIILSYGIL
jgi:quercetin dioxygenase-like cupin family protein